MTIEQFNARVDELDEMVAKRARHVITENDRTEEAAIALSKGDIKRMGELMAESHAQCVMILKSRCAKLITSLIP